MSGRTPWDRESDRGFERSSPRPSLWGADTPPAQGLPWLGGSERESDHARERDAEDERRIPGRSPAGRPVAGTVAITGSTGLLGRALVARARAGGWTVLPLGGREPGGTDVTDPRAVLTRLRAGRPAVVIHAAAWPDLDGCESDPERAVEVHGAGTAHVIAAARKIGAHVVAVSTDCVFSGEQDDPYREDDPVGPVQVYGRSKLVAEREVPPEHAIVRTSWLIGPSDRGFVASVVARGRRGRTFPVVVDQRGRPTPVGPLADALLELGRRRSRGTWHVVGPEIRTRFELARETLAAAGLEPGLARPTATADLDPQPRARRPANAVLEPGRWLELGLPALPHHQGALEQAVDHLRR